MSKSFVGWKCFGQKIPSIIDVDIWSCIRGLDVRNIPSVRQCCHLISDCMCLYVAQDTKLVIIYNCFCYFNDSWLHTKFTLHLTILTLISKCGLDLGRMILIFFRITRWFIPSHDRWTSYRMDTKYSSHQTMLTFDLRIWSCPSS